MDKTVERAFTRDVFPESTWPKMPTLIFRISIPLGLRTTVNADGMQKAAVF